MKTIYGILLILTIYVLSCGQEFDGSVGSQGPPGPHGSGCSVQTVSVSSVAPNGGALIQCQDGTSSLILNGTVGVPGTVIAPIQFCPGVTTYPSQFNEVGFCISNNLYAVYSANDGFLSYIPPGYYSSNAINSTCNFYVNANCVISY
jgi:hypothetical protein